MSVLALVKKCGSVFGSTANEGTRGSLVRVTLDVVCYSWADINKYLKVSESI